MIKSNIVDRKIELVKKYPYIGECSSLNKKLIVLFTEQNVGIILVANEYYKAEEIGTPDTFNEDDFIVFKGEIILQNEN